MEYDRNRLIGKLREAIHDLASSEPLRVRLGRAFTGYAVFTDEKCRKELSVEASRMYEEIRTAGALRDLGEDDLGRYGTFLVSFFLEALESLHLAEERERENT